MVAIKYFIILVLFSVPIHAKQQIDFANIKDTNVRKQAFFNYLLPIIELENTKILKLRNTLQKMQKTTLSHAQKYNLKILAKTYKTKPNITSLLMHIDIIPSSLALAQAAIESSWGRSRFAAKYNNFFGIWCFSKGCGVVPKKREKNKKHEVARYKNVAHSVMSYMHNLNSHRVYKKLRDIRANLRSNKHKITGLALADGLGSYSGIGDEYIKTIKKIINYNNLKDKNI